MTVPGGEHAGRKSPKLSCKLPLACGLRRAELVELQYDDLQIREEHWVVADLIGKGKHIRTVPMPGWVKRAVDDWMQAAGITAGFIFRAVSRTGVIWGDHITPKAIWHVVKGAAGPARNCEARSSRPASQLRE